ncbi:MAG: hypothetical protein AABY22_12850 [Nanoarchaeota archaeon]|mgnify:CR=1 FL=1
MAYYKIVLNIYEYQSKIDETDCCGLIKDEFTLPIEFKVFRNAKIIFNRIMNLLKTLNFSKRV